MSKEQITAADLVLSQKSGGAEAARANLSNHAIELLQAKATDNATRPSGYVSAPPTRDSGNDRRSDIPVSHPPVKTPTSDSGSGSRSRADIPVGSPPVGTPTRDSGNDRRSGIPVGNPPVVTHRTENGSASPSDRPVLSGPKIIISGIPGDTPVAVVPAKPPRVSNAGEHGPVNTPRTGTNVGDHAPGSITVPPSDHRHPSPDVGPVGTGPIETPSNGHRHPSPDVGPVGTGPIESPSNGHRHPSPDVGPAGTGPIETPPSSSEHPSRFNDRPTPVPIKNPGDSDATGLRPNRLPAGTEEKYRFFPNLILFDK